MGWGGQDSAPLVENVVNVVMKVEPGVLREGIMKTRPGG